MAHSRDLPNIRSRFADRHLADVERSMKAALKAIYDEALARIEHGQDPEALRLEVDNWAQKIFELREDEFVEMVAQGYFLAQQEFGSKRALRAMGKAAGEPNPQLDALKERLRTLGISDNLRKIAKIESETTMRRIEKTWQRKLDEDLTVKEMAAEIKATFEADVANRAMTIARTETIWAYNEGAMLTYKDAGFQYGEWLVTEDDLLCDFCAVMPSRNPIALGNNYAMEGEVITVANASLTVLGNVEHPPLHSRCRCSLVPYVDDIGG